MGPQLMFALGVLAALLASVLFNVGVALQALEARATPRRLNLRLSLLGSLLRRWRWVVGLLLGLLGVGPQVLALALASFVVVQPTLVAGLLLLLYIGARWLGERVTALAWVGVVAVIGGLALVSWGAPPHSETHRGGATVIAVVAALAATGLAPFPLRATRVARPMLSIVASGCAFGATNVTTKLMSDDIGLGHWPNAVAWAAVALAMGVVATLAAMSALQQCAASIVVPVSTAVQTFLPIVLEPLFLRERWSATEFSGAPIVAGLLIALAGTVLVARTDAVSRLAAGTA